MMLITIFICICVFAIFFLPYFAEIIESQKVTKENYIQNLKRTLFLFIILNIPILYWKGGNVYV